MLPRAADGKVIAVVTGLRQRVPGPADLPVVMGVLNVTPDSFSDGGSFPDVESAVARADQMVRDGAAIIDVGPESTRPGAGAVPDDEQIRRAVRVIRAIRQRQPDVGLSIDTQSAVVARAALEAGADWINDVSALRTDPNMARLAADAGAPVILMHMLGTPRTMQTDPTYVDVVREVVDFLEERIAFAASAGIALDRIVIDPGIGFGKTVEHNLALLAGLNVLTAIGPPVLIGASRKSFIGRVLGVEDPRDRLSGSLACAAVAVMGGARVIRAHDVRETVEVVCLCHRIGVPRLV